jgi:hypothetical protein
MALWLEWVAAAAAGGGVRDDAVGVADVAYFRGLVLLAEG